MINKMIVKVTPKFILFVVIFIITTFALFSLPFGETVIVKFQSLITQLL